jgi:hypothetical protein
MGTNVTAIPPMAEKLERALIGGDLAQLSAQEKIQYYNSVCQSLGLNPLTKPFAYLKLNGKEVLYALKDCTEQLRNIHAISLTIPARELMDDVYVVTARASRPDGRVDESTGAVTVGGIKGEAKANAMMKAETKAKRRVTLSICGLGMLDETEVETIPTAQPAYQKFTKEEREAAHAEQQKIAAEKIEQIEAEAETVSWSWQSVAPGFEKLKSDVGENFDNYLKACGYQSIDQLEDESAARRVYKAILARYKSEQPKDTPIFSTAELHRPKVRTIDAPEPVIKAWSRMHTVTGRVEELEKIKSLLIAQYPADGEQSYFAVLETHGVHETKEAAKDNVTARNCVKDLYALLEGVREEVTA